MSDRIWVKKYPPGIPANIDENAYSNLLEMIEETLVKYKGLPAFANMGKSLTYGQIDTMSRNFGAYLNSRGLEPGDKIALMMPNCLQYPIALFGAIRAGLIVVNTNPLYTPSEMKHQFNDAGVKAVVITNNYGANLEKIIKETSIKTVILTSLGEMLGTKGKIVNFAVKYIKKLVPKFELTNAVSFKTALSQGKKFELPDVNQKRDDILLLQYTGGTTGVAKGAMLTHANLIANMMQLKSIMSPHTTEGKEIALSPLPMYHIFAFSVNCLALGGIGALNVLVTNPRDLPSVLKEFKNYNISILTGVNTLFNAMLNHKDFAGLNFSSLKYTVGGGMAVQKAVAERWQSVTGCFLCEGYGLTETSPVLSVNPIEGGRLGTIGLPVPSTDLRIMGEDGTVQEAGGVGEIQAKGPQVMKGYYNRPDETAKVMTSDGWFSTGDIGVMEEDGFFRIVDRKKNMILVSGFNVYPNELEDLVVTHPKVLEVAAVGKKDERSGEVVALVIVKKDKSCTEQEIKDFCREHLTGYKNPKHIEFWDELPKTNVGKILHREIRNKINGK